MSRQRTCWPEQLAPIGAIRFARRSSNYAQTVRFYRELVGLPLYETFAESYGSNGAIFGLPSSHLTMEIVEAVPEPGTAVPPHNPDQLCLNFPDKPAQQAAIARLQEERLQPVEQHPYWEAAGAVTYRDPDGREVVFAPFVYGANEPAEGSTSGRHEFPAN